MIVSLGALYNRAGDASLRRASSSRTKGADASIMAHRYSDLLKLGKMHERSWSG